MSGSKGYRILATKAQRIESTMKVCDKRLTHPELRLIDAGNRAVLRYSVCEDCYDLQWIKLLSRKLRAHQVPRKRKRKARDSVVG